MATLPIVISQHARTQMVERGVHEAEVEIAIRQGVPEPARSGRMMFRKNFQFDGTWRGRYYRVKQVAAAVAREPSRLVVVTVYSFYF